MVYQNIKYPKNLELPLSIIFGTMGVARNNE